MAIVSHLLSWGSSAPLVQTLFRQIFSTCAVKVKHSGRMAGRATARISLLLIKV